MTVGIHQTSQLSDGELLSQTVRLHLPRYLIRGKTRWLQRRKVAALLTELSVASSTLWARWPASSDLGSEVTEVGEAAFGSGRLGFCDAEDEGFDQEKGRGVAGEEARGASPRDECLGHPGA